MTKFFGFLLGIAVACALPATFGVLAADGGIELSIKEQALAYGSGALVFWAVVSLFSGAAALGAALAFGTMIYAVHYIPNRTTNFLNDVPGVTAGMIDGLKSTVLTGVIPILAVISLIYSIQLIVGAVRRRRLRRAEEARLAQEQALAAQHEEAGSTSQYPPDDEYPIRFESQSHSFTDQYADRYEEDDTPEPTRQFPVMSHDEQTTQFAPDEQTRTDRPDGPKVATEEPPPAPEGPKAEDGRTTQFAAEPSQDEQQYAGQYRERMDEPDTGWDLIAIPAEGPAPETHHQYPVANQFRPATG